MMPREGMMRGLKAPPISISGGMGKTEARERNAGREILRAFGLRMRAV